MKIYEAFNWIKDADYTPHGFLIFNENTPVGQLKGEALKTIFEAAKNDELVPIEVFNQVKKERDEAVKNLEAIKQEPRWIPVTERLPDKLTDVNIAFDDCSNEYDVAYLRTTFNETYRKNGAEYEWVSSMGEATYADYEVSAWMEIQPYKAESEEINGR